MLQWTKGPSISPAAAVVSDKGLKEQQQLSEYGGVTGVGRLGDQNDFF